MTDEALTGSDGEVSESGPAGPPPAGQVRGDLTALGVATTATVAAFRFREATILPTLAFFAWAWVFARLLLGRGTK